MSLIGPRTTLKGSCGMQASKSECRVAQWCTLWSYGTVSERNSSTLMTDGNNMRPFSFAGPTPACLPLIRHRALRTATSPRLMSTSKTRKLGTKSRRHADTSVCGTQLTNSRSICGAFRPLNQEPELPFVYNPVSFDTAGFGIVWWCSDTIAIRSCAPC